MLHLVATPTMPPLALPIDGQSIVTAIIGIGVAVLLLAMAAIIGFRLARKLMNRVASGVDGGTEYYDHTKHFGRYGGERVHYSDFPDSRRNYRRDRVRRSHGA